MSVFLVRTSDTLRLIGIFVAEDSSALFAQVDEQVDPCHCEYLRLRHGEGLFLDGQFADESYALEEAEQSLVDVSDACPIQASDHLEERLRQLLHSDWTSFEDEDFSGAYGDKRGPALLRDAD